MTSCPGAGLWDFDRRRRADKLIRMIRSPPLRRLRLVLAEGNRARGVEGVGEQLERFQLERRREEKALRLEDAARTQIERLRVGLDALGYDLGAEIPCHQDEPVEHRHLGSL